MCNKNVKDEKKKNRKQYSITIQMRTPITQNNTNLVKKKFYFSQLCFTAMYKEELFLEKGIAMKRPAMRKLQKRSWGESYHMIGHFDSVLCFLGPCRYERIYVRRHTWIRLVWFNKYCTELNVLNPLFQC